MPTGAKRRVAPTPATGAAGATLPSVDLTPVWEELAQHDLDTQGRGGDDLDAFGSRGERYPELSAAAQSLLAQGYQQYRRLKARQDAGEGLDCSERELEKARAQSEWCSEYLLGSVFRLVRVKVWERARGRFGEAWASELFSELLADATATVLEAADTFDPAKGPTFASWVSERLDHDLPTHMGRHGRLGSMPQAWSRLSRIAHHVKPELEAALGRAATAGEVRAALEERCRTWAEEHLSAAQQELVGAEREKAIVEKMRKQGMTKALTEVPEILAAMQSEINLDAPLGDGSGTGLGDLLSGGDTPEDVTMAAVEEDEYAQVLRVGTGNLNSEGREIVLTYLGLGEEEGGTYKRVAQQFGVPDLEVRHLVRDAQARLKAPHAQYAHLSAGISSQFDAECDEDSSARAALGRRGRARLELDAETLLVAAQA